MATIGQIIHIALRILSTLVFIQAVLSFFMSPYHPVRQKIDPLVEPLLAPIRRVVPPVGMVDLSPLILIVLIQVVDAIVVSLFR
ncbi:MAG: YggT family protein [Anaerolineales bacterium]|jgi:YggT family protein|nr:YggT family protein [Anaerolineales bacterium]